MPEAAEDVLAGLEDLDANELGKRLNFTLAEYKAIGARFDRHPATIAPCDATREQVDEHLAAVRDAKKPERAVAEKNRRLRKKLEREQQQPPATLSNELVARRCTAIVGYSKRHPGPHPTHDLVGGLKRWEAFADATSKTIRNVIDGLLRLAAAGKLPALSDHLTISRNTAKNRRTTYTVEYRK
jgi:hypothetical protein